MKLDKLTKKELIEMAEDLKKKYEEMKKYEKAAFIDFDGHAFTEPANMVGILGSKVGGVFVRTRVKIEYLEKILKIIKDMNNIENKTEDNVIDICIADDFPLLLGNYDKEKNKFIGFVVAPRVGV